MRSTLLALIFITSGAAVMFSHWNGRTYAETVGTLPVPASYSVPEAAKESPTPKPGAPPEARQTPEASSQDTSRVGSRRKSKAQPGACYVVVARTPLIGAFGNHIIDLYSKQPRYHEVGEKLRSIVLPAESFQHPKMDPANAERPLVQSPKDWGYTHVDKSSVQEIACAEVPPNKPEHRGPVPGLAGYSPDSAEETVDDQGIIAF